MFRLKFLMPRFFDHFFGMSHFSKADIEIRSTFRPKTNEKLMIWSKSGTYRDFSFKKWENTKIQSVFQAKRSRKQNIKDFIWNILQKARLSLSNVHNWSAYLLMMINERHVDNIQNSYSFFDVMLKAEFVLNNLWEFAVFSYHSRNQFLEYILIYCYKHIQNVIFHWFY
jgi:hypothetical protein